MVEKLRPFRAKLLKPAAYRNQVYNTRRWRELSKWGRRTQRVCGHCRNALVEEVHHVVPIDQNPRLAFEPSNLVGLCIKCHHEVHRDTKSSWGRRVAKPGQAGGHTPPI